MNEYGLTQNNPIILQSEEFYMSMLSSVVTINGFHILFHFIGSTLINNRRVDKYEVFSEDNGIQTLYFQTSFHNTNLWIPPSGFVFQDEFIVEEYIVFHGLDYFFKNITDYDRPVEVFDKMLEKKFELFIYENVGVNFTCSDFPKSLYQKYIYEHTELEHSTDENWG